MLASCTSIRQRPKPTSMAEYAETFRALGEPVDVRAELGSDEDECTRLLYIPSFSSVVAITVRAGTRVLPGHALVRTKILHMCVIEYARGTNDYFFVSAWSPDHPVSQEPQGQYRDAYPGKNLDFDRINDFLRRTVNVLNWFGRQTRIMGLDRYEFRKRRPPKTRRKSTGQGA